MKSTSGFELPPRKLAAKAKRIVKRIAHPIWPDQLHRALNAGIGDGTDLLYVHSGISHLGYFTGGPGSIANALREFCGTLFQPTHTYCYPSSADEPAPVFDAKSTPSQVGLFAEAFRKRPNVVRSIHSTHSIAAEGTLAKEICAKHYDCDTPCGSGTPYSQLVYRRASALMFGVSFRYYTPFHTAEGESGSEFAYKQDELVRLRFIDEAGQLQERVSKRQNHIAPRFHEVGDLLEQQGFVRRIPLGRGYLLFIADMLRVHEFLVGRLRRTPDFLRATCSVPLT